MNIKFLREATDDHWKVELQFTDFNGREQEQLAAYGGFVIDIGGSFAGLETFSMATNEILIPDTLPVTVSFSIEELTHDVARDRAITWETTIESRIQSALTTWMADDPASGNSTRCVTLTA